MATLRPPSLSRSPSPTPPENGRNMNRQSMGPSRVTAVPPASPRPGGMSGARPTSELLGGGGMFQTPEAEAIDQWFENLQNYEATLEEMAAASMDVNFKEELSAIEQWFKVLSEAERTAALYSLLQHSTQVQIRFFITVLQQMARSDPMTALLSPAMGGSMQNQMEAKLASLNLKSPGLKSGLPSSPTARSFNTSMNPNNRQSLVVETTSSYLSPDSAALSPPAGGNDAAATLAQQRAKLKANNSAHRISAPVLSSIGDGRNPWSQGLQLGQVVEQNAPSQEVTINPASRPKSTEFSGSPRPNAQEATLSPMPGDSWASMVNTPLIPMFQNTSKSNNLDAATSKLADWSSGPSVPRMGDPKIFRRTSKSATPPIGDPNANGVYGDDGDLIHPGQGNQQQGQQIQQQQQQRRNVSGGLSVNNPNAYNGGAGWNGARSPALSNVSSGRFGGSDDASAAAAAAAAMNGLGMGGFNMGLPSPGMMGMPNSAGLMNPQMAQQMGQMSPFGMNMNMMNLAAMGVTPEALLAAQMAASGFGSPNWMGMQGGMAGMNGMNNMAGGRGGQARGPGSSRGPGGIGKAGSSNGRDGGGGGGGGGGGAGAKKDEEDVDPQLLTDVPAWLRSLRLHKYTPNFEGMKWQDMVMMDEDALEKNGVAALGARRKMLKTFEVVRKKMGMEMPV